jgi:hypothetical protein
VEGTQLGDDDAEHRSGPPERLPHRGLVQVHRKSIGGGTVGGTTALRYGFWTFESNGRFSTSSAASVSVKTHVTGQGERQVANGGRTSASVGGTYEIDGVVLTLRYDDGRVDYRTITTTQKPNPSSVTINGKMFNRM